MKDYSKMSDFQINQFITCCEFDCHDWPNNANGDFYHCGFDGNSYFEVSVKDYCNNPSDAWPVMEENKIGIAFVNCEWRASSVQAGYHEYIDNSAFKAAMIVYLMMKDEDQ